MSLILPTLEMFDMERQINTISLSFSISKI
jgi:hypothetical protein